ncbi:hypothetical protein LY76DRAFT_12981 [Colletotrichum caudatum]|nr:hypothetical protein LY76DRAFT_12981 [Colletotrichum caudatum]
MKESWSKFRWVKRVGRQFSRSSSGTQDSGERERENERERETGTDKDGGEVRQVECSADDDWETRCVCSKQPLAARQDDGTGADLAATSASGLIGDARKSVTSGTGGSRKGGEQYYGYFVRSYLSRRPPCSRLSSPSQGYSRYDTPAQPGVTLTGSSRPIPVSKTGNTGSLGESLVPEDQRPRESGREGKGRNEHLKLAEGRVLCEISRYVVHAGSKQGVDWVDVKANRDGEPCSIHLAAVACIDSVSVTKPTMFGMEGSRAGQRSIHRSFVCFCSRLVLYAAYSPRAFGII